MTHGNSTPDASDAGDRPATGTSLRFSLPLSPSVNNQYATVGRRRVLSSGARSFRKDVKKIVERARLTGSLDPVTESALRDALLGVYLTFHFETPLRRDLDGGLKITLDALCDALELDDRMIVDLHLSKKIDPLNPHVDVELEVIQEWCFDRSYIYLGEGLESSGSLETSEDG